MLAPTSELDRGEPLVHTLGVESLSLWPKVVEGLEIPLQMEGSLLVAHANDSGEFARTKRALLMGGGELRAVGATEIRALEPSLRFEQALFLPREGHVDNRAIVEATNPVLDIRRPSELPDVEDAWEVDCRGLAARDIFPELRGVRGELIYLHAPEVELHRPIRMIHPRYPLYIVPRAEHLFVVGASQIESEDDSPVSVRTALELLSAAYAVHPGFAEGRIVDMSTACRPAFPDHLPRIYYDGEARRLAVNGLFRHGFLLSPVLAGMAADLIEKGVAPSHPILHPFPV